MDDMPELNLVAESIQQGDFEAYKRLFVRYYAVVRTFVGGFVKDEKVAKDIAQDVFMKLWQYRNDCVFFRSGDGFSSFTPIEDYGIYINPMAVGKGTDWIEEITRIAPYQNYNVSLLGCVKNFRYFSSLGYTNKRGIIDGSGVQRATGRINVDYDVVKWLSVGTNFTLCRCRLFQCLRLVRRLRKRLYLHLWQYAAENRFNQSIPTARSLCGRCYVDGEGCVVVGGEPHHKNLSGQYCLSQYDVLSRWYISDSSSHAHHQSAYRRGGRVFRHKPPAL